MKNNHKKKALTFGDFIAAAFRAWGTRRARGLVRLALLRKVRALLDATAPLPRRIPSRSD